MRLIDADALLKAFYRELDNAILYGCIVKPPQDLIKQAPTIDTVRHGRWKHERLPSTSGGSYAVVRCSVCGYQYPMTETNYCPHCGAKMDGANND